MNRHYLVQKQWTCNYCKNENVKFYEVLAYVVYTCLCDNYENRCCTYEPTMSKEIIEYVLIIIWVITLLGSVTCWKLWYVDFVMLTIDGSIDKPEMLMMKLGEIS